MSKNKQFSDGHNNSKYPDSCSSCGGRTGMDHVKITNASGTKRYHNNSKCAPPDKPHGEFEDRYDWMSNGNISKQDFPKKQRGENYPPKNEGPKKPPNDNPPAGGVKIKPKGPKSPIAPAANAKKLAKNK